MPENATVIGDVSLPYWNKPLPAGLHIVGSLRLQNNTLTSLPPHLHVTENIFLVGAKHLESLPSDLQVGHLSLYECENISTLPEDLVAKTVDVSGTKITSIPKGVGTVSGGYTNFTPAYLAANISPPSPENKTRFRLALRSLEKLPEEAKKVIFANESPWKSMLLTQMGEIYDGKLQNLFNCVKDDMVEHTAVALREYLQKNEKPSAELEVFHDFIRAFSMSGIGPEEHLEAWEILRYIVAHVSPPQDKDALRKMLSELDKLPEEAKKVLFADGTSWKNMLLTQMDVLYSLNLQSLFNLIKDEMVQTTAGAVLDCLKKFEKPPGGLGVFQNFTCAVGMSGIGAQEHFEPWGKLAEVYLDIACNKANLSEKDKKVAETFRQELKTRTDTKQLTYEWFFLFLR